MKKTITLFLLSLLIPQLTFADTKVVFESSDGSHTIWSNDKYFRITQAKPNKSKANKTNEDGMTGNMLGDYRSGKKYIIVEKDKIIIDMSTPLPAFLQGSNLSGKHKTKKIKIKYIKKDTGKIITGLNVTKYDIVVKGEKCFEVSLTKNKAFTSFAKKLEKIISDDDNDSQEGSNCEQAENQIDNDKENKYGYPVKIIDANGAVKMEIKEFNTNAKAPKNHLSLPKGYKVMSMMEAMTEAMKNVKFNSNSE